MIGQWSPAAPRSTVQIDRISACESAWRVLEVMGCEFDLFYGFPQSQMELIPTAVGGWPLQN